MTGQDPKAIRFYIEEELDALYERDPLEAMRISRQQELAKRQAERAPAQDGLPLEFEAVARALESARQVLLRDGGDLELVEVSGTVVKVRMKGNCVGCPRAPLDLKNIVEKAVRKHFPQITEVVNTF
jgi:toxin CptA